MDRVDKKPDIFVAASEFRREEMIGGFCLAVDRKSAILLGAELVLRVVESESTPGEGRSHRGQDDDMRFPVGALRREDRWQEQRGEQEVSEMIGTELCLETFFTTSEGREGGDSSVVDENLTRWENVRMAGDACVSVRLAHMNRKAESVDLGRRSTDRVSRKEIQGDNFDGHGGRSLTNLNYRFLSSRAMSKWRGHSSRC